MANGEVVAGRMNVVVHLFFFLSVALLAASPCLLLGCSCWDQRKGGRQWPHAARKKTSGPSGAGRPSELPSMAGTGAGRAVSSIRPTDPLPICPTDPLPIRPTGHLPTHPSGSLPDRPTAGLPARPTAGVSPPLLVSDSNQNRVLAGLISLMISPQSEEHSLQAHHFPPLFFRNLWRTF